jgi:hypothetical protein
VLTALLTDLVVEKVIMASEIADQPRRPSGAGGSAGGARRRPGQPITIEYCLHEAFKARSRQSKAIVRSGEVTPTPTLFSAPVWRFNSSKQEHKAPTPCRAPRCSLPILELSGIVKAFPGVRALDEAGLGSIRAR